MRGVFRNWRPASRPRLTSSARFLIVLGAVALLLGAGGSVYAAGTGPPPKKPNNQSLPTISGTAQQGQTLTGSPGTWSGTDPISYAYQWRRCNSSGASCSNISAATNQTYTLTSADTANTIRLVVTASNSAGSSSATSAATAVVVPTGAPVNTSPPTITGTAQQGQTLTGTAGTWSGTDPISYAYRWRRCDSAGASCTDISGATGQSYVLTAGDGGHTIRLNVTGSNAAGSSVATSAATGVVAAAVPPSNTASPTISGTAQQGQTLTGTAGTWSGTDPISYAYRWRSCDSTGVSCTDISGATGLSYTLTSSDGGKTIRFRVTATNVAGSTTADSAATAAVVAPPSNTALPTITGTAQPGQTLTGQNGTWSGTDPISYAYQWRRCDSAGAGCADISGATSQSYTLTADDLGSTIRINVTGSNAAGSSTATSAASGVVSLAAPPSNTALPTISGIPQEGQTLTANPGTWSGTQPITYTYQWRNCVAYRDTVLLGSPVAYWRFGEGSGPTAADASGNLNNGTYGGGFSLGQSGAITGDPNTAVRFTGSPSTGNVVVPDSASLDYGDSVTYEAWVKLLSLPPSTSAGANIITKNVGTMLMRIYPSGVLALRQSGGGEIAQSTVALNADGKYHYLVGTKTGSSVHIYIDGVDVTGTVANQTLTNNASQLVMGHNPVSSNDGLDGYIDEAAVYSHALTASEVSGRYAAGNQQSCTDISGANAQTYKLVSTDVGRAIKVRVTASNSGGSSSATSAATAFVAAGNIGYRDQPIGNAGVAPTGSKPESKLWWNDGSWWASMWSATASSFDIFRLDLGSQSWMDTGVHLDNRSGSRADVLWAGGHLYVASHLFSACGCSTPSFGNPSRLYRYSYDSASQTYSLDSGFPVAINDTSTETLVIDRDSTGTLWATWTQSNQVYVNHTIGSDSTWGTPFLLPVSGASNLNADDISSLVAFGGNKIGVMWSNQIDSAMYFAVHLDGDADTTWTPSRNAVPGPNYADDHISLKSLQADASGRVFAVVKTSLGDLPNPNPNAPLILLLARDPATGDWSNYVFGRVADDHTRAILVLDDQHLVLHVFATAPVNGGTIYEKTSPVNAISFATGLGTPVLHDASSLDMNNVTSTKQNVNSTTGLVVMGSNDTTQPGTSYPSPTGGYYWHNYEPIAP
jgi:Concanavalin A-like lectin/glucanases superfamily